MRIVRNLVFVTVLLLAGNFAKAGDVKGMSKSENTQIRDLLSSVQISNYVKSETKLNISFIVNDKNELIVVSTNNVDLDGVVKNALNYHKITVSELEYNKLYTIPVVIR